MVSTRRLMGTVASCGVAAVALATAGQAKAATAPYNTGFEVSQGFTQGAFLTGQGGFTSSVTPDVTSGSGAAVVATYLGTNITPSASGGAQYVQINDLSGIAPTTFATYFPSLSSITPTAGTSVVNVVGQIGFTAGASTSAATGAVFGLDAFDGTSAQNQIADLSVNAFNGAVTVNNGGTITSFTAPTGMFTQYQLQLNYATQKYTVFATTLGTGGTTTNLGTFNFETSATTFSSAGFDTFSRGSATAYGLGLVDNLAITAVPEPASASLVLGGLAFAGARRRRRIAR